RKTYVERTSLVIEPSGSYTFRGMTEDAMTVLGMPNSPDRTVARVVGVRFEDGETWGSFRELPPPPPPTVDAVPPEPPRILRPEDLIRKSSGVLVNSAIHRVDADYPPLARAAQVSGSVVVEVIVDEG